MPIRVLIVDDHNVVRQGLRMFLEADPQFEVVGEAADGADAVEMASGLGPAVILMDLFMPRMDGLEATRLICQQYPEIQVIAVTSVLEDASTANAIQAGAISYLLKNSDVFELRQAIQRAAEGRVQLAPRVATRLMREVKLPTLQEVRLKEKQTRILALLAEGHSDAEIAGEMAQDLTEIRQEIKDILAQLQVPSRTLAVLWAMKVGLAAPATPPACP